MLLDHQNFYLVGIKGVGMTSLAQLLAQAQKNVQGSDVAENFPTQEILDELGLKIDIGFKHDLPTNIDCVIYSGANGGSQNKQVLQAVERGVAAFSHAEALGEVFNLKQGIAVCGASGKSTTSAMLAFLTSKLGQPQSYSVGVGRIGGLDDVGHWQKNAPYFIAEADEYAEDPTAQSKKARFLYLKPYVTICTNLAFDHPDVYEDFDHTQKTFGQFFEQIKEDGYLIINGNNEALFNLAKQVTMSRDISLVTFGQGEGVDFQIINYEIEDGLSTTTFKYQNQQYEFNLNLPGIFNAYNALAALAVLTTLGFDLEKCCQLIADYKSIKRRFEFLGEKSGVLYYDDYAHHPQEIASTIRAISEWFPKRRIVIAFQPHTYSRTKMLFNEFVSVFADADEIVMTDIFASAREEKDIAVSTDKLVEALQKKYPQKKITNLHDNKNLADFATKNLQPGNVIISLGAGDIYKFFDLI
ncbi:MAG: UDP-N-acetylmuramate--L-alanine ligase [Pseudomonadales bacterium]|jgi:UDP-N-acetylmuramate--alanine ligase|nr:UDP-N-acetylmuramate--L-alanine ligase [Pseudomonadales bacterium]